MPDLGKVGLALGGGSARGWAHIGVINVLHEAGIKPDIVVGTSIGALIGAAFATEQMKEVEAWARSLKWRDIVRFVDPTFVGGLVRARRVFAFFRQHFPDINIEDLSMPYAAVATDLSNGQEVWIREGSLLDAIRASVAIPGLIQPVWDGRRWLVDGILVNPVPASVCRAMGADFVIAVDLNTTKVGRWSGGSRDKSKKGHKTDDGEDAPTRDTSILDFWKAGGKPIRMEKDTEGKTPPSIIEVISASLTIMQVHITHSRLSGDPPDLLMIPRLGDIGMMEFHRAEEAIKAGRTAAERALATL